MKAVILTPEQAAAIANLLASLPWGQVAAVMDWYRDLKVVDLPDAPKPEPPGE